MNREAVLHIQMSNYAHAINEEQIVFRLRAARGDLKFCRLFYGDRACRRTPVIFSCIPMEMVAQDWYYDYFEIVLESPYTRICYYFELNDGQETVLYYADMFRETTVDDRSEYYQLPFNRREDIADIPSWVKDAVIYNIFPDSFATSKKYISVIETEKEFQGHKTQGKNGGTIVGMIENVDYIKNLGINCIYINPIFAAGEYHKYDLLDYYHIDPCFGTNEEFKQMVRVYHKNGIRVIIDGVFNHCGWNFFAFEDVVKHGENSRYKDWFYRLDYPVIRPDNMRDIPNYECFGYERLMPKLNTSNPEVIAYFCDVCRFWLEEYDIDGWRLDVASEVNDDFWRQFRKTAKRVKPDSFLIGEVWESAGHWLEGDQFDSTMNYDLRKNCKEFFAEGNIDAFDFDSRVTLMRMRYKKNMLYGQLNLLDSHDVSRFFSLCKENVERFQLAILFQILFIGIPSIFYGDEQLISGLLEEDYRQPMVWCGTNKNFRFYQKAINLRKEHREIRYGDYRTLYAEKNGTLYVFERYTRDESIIVILNAGDQKRKTPFLDGTQKILWQKGLEEDSLDRFGFAIIKR